MLRFAGLAIALLAMCSGRAFSQVPIELKFPADSKQVTESAFKVQQTLTLAGMDLETKSSTFAITSKLIGKRANDGSLQIQEKVDVLQTEIGLPGGITVQFDSANPDKKADNPLLEPVLERLRVTLKHPVTTVLDGMNKIKEIKLPEGVAETLDPSNKSLFDPEKRKKAAEQSSGYLPDEAVKPGDTWERSPEADFGGGQTMAFRVKYTYVGAVEEDGLKLEKITAKVFEVSYSIDPTNPIKVSKSDLKVTESEETILFDRERGVLRQKTAKLRIQGPLTLVINGAELEGKVDLTINETSKLQK